MTPDTHVNAWLRSAAEDAERRGLRDLVPLLETLARSTAQLRHVDRHAPQDLDDDRDGTGDEPRG